VRCGYWEDEVCEKIATHQVIVIRTALLRGAVEEGLEKFMSAGSVRAAVPRGKVLDWLLEPDQLSVRYLTLNRFLGKSETDSDVRDAKARIPSAAWAAQILGRRDPGGWWVRDRHPSYPKYISTNWNLLALSDLGATRGIPKVRASCEYWMDKSPLKGGGVGGMSNGHGHHCYTGNMARALIRFGY